MYRLLGWFIVSLCCSRKDCLYVTNCVQNIAASPDAPGICHVSLYVSDMHYSTDRFLYRSLLVTMHAHCRAHSKEQICDGSKNVPFSFQRTNHGSFQSFWTTSPSQTKNTTLLLPRRTCIITEQQRHRGVNICVEFKHKEFSDTNNYP